MRIGKWTPDKHPAWEGWDDIVKWDDAIVGVLPFPRDNWGGVISGLESLLREKSHRPRYNLV
jgi:hypothetical protein